MSHVVGNLFEGEGAGRGDSSRIEFGRGRGSDGLWRRRWGRRRRAGQLRSGQKDHHEVLRRRLRWLCGLGFGFERGKEIEGLGERMRGLVQWVDGREMGESLPFWRRIRGDGGRMRSETEVRE